MKKLLLVLLVVLALTFCGDSKIEQERAKAFVYKYSGADLSLKELMNLKGFSFFYKKITDISPLKSLGNLFWLDLRGNPISDKDIADLKRELPNCDIKQ
jgi:Leucine-rich repeat (LRR) protein